MARSPSRRPLLAVVIAVAVVAGLTGSVASATTPSATTGSTAPQPPGLGMGSKAALAQEHCAENGRMDFNMVGSGPWCVNPWPATKDNGGATAPGVTATDVKIVLYIPSDDMLATEKGIGVVQPTNAATRQRATIESTVNDLNAAYRQGIEQYGSYQLWGREPVYEYVTATGRDEAAQRAGAIEVINRKPFIVVDMTESVSGGAPVFSAAVAAKKIIVVSPSTNSEIAASQRPYRWGFGADPDSDAVFAAGLIGRSLAGKKARWAGDDLASKPRVFGALYPTSGFDLDAFERLAKQEGAQVKSSVGFDPNDTTQIAAQATTMVTRLKSAGVTTVVLFAPPAVVTAAMAAATSQAYSPEWVLTGRGYHDLAIFGRANDQEQMRHAFGLSVLNPYPDGTAPPYAEPFPWYWGRGNGNTWPISLGSLSYIYKALHYAGPTLTARNVEKGLFAAPAIGGAADGTTAFQLGFGADLGMPYDEYSQSGADRALLWWDPDLTGPSNTVGSVGKGMFLYLDGGAHVSFEDLPSREPKFFDPAASVATVPVSAAYPDGVIPAAMPCNGCPSSGGPTTPA